jgi:hypothetical protein
MEKEPRFIKEFSKERSPEERRQVAEQIKAKRAEYFAEKRTKVEKQKVLQESITERERATVEILNEIKALEAEIERLSSSGLSKLMNYFKLRKLRADLVVGQRTYEELKQQQEQAVGELKVLSEQLSSEETPPALQEAREMLRKFYRRQKEKWANSEYTKEDITRYFSEEHLASLSLEDYVLLLKRFPSEMVTHVTRQGIRDHIGMIYHTVDAGAYTDGFMKMVEDGRLRSPLGVYLVESAKEEAIAKFLKLDRFKTREEAMAYLEKITNPQRQGEPGSYADKMAVHFATEEVADAYYGSERGNEIFIAYPSAYIASQYYFNGQLTEGGGGYWNDQWVWANEERGMDLNAGIIFIPEEARVDRNTGSRYELDENKNPMINVDYKAALQRVVDSPDFYDFADRVMEITGKLTQRWDEFNLTEQNRELLKQLEPFRQRLEQEFGITDPRLQFTILDYQTLFGLEVHKKLKEKGQEDPFNSIDSIIEGALEREGILYREAKDTISSKEFWENYFNQRPNKRPAHIVYYKGKDPTRALYEWREKHGIRKKAKSKELGFEERMIPRTAPEATAGLERFRSIAIKVIEDYFDTKEISSTP